MIFGARRVLVVFVGLLIGALVLLAWQQNAFGIRVLTPGASVTMLFDQTPAYPGYAWSRDGQSVGPFELNTIAAPAHCGWESATTLHIGWPPGTVASSAAQARQYLRDPKGVLPDRKYRELLVANVALPRDARPTGYRLGAIELYLSPSDQDEAIYVVGPSGTERWPRSDPMTHCA